MLAVAYLNNVRVSHCVEADEEAGYIVRYETNEVGRVQWFADVNGPHRIRETGTVRIELPHNA